MTAYRVSLTLPYTPVHCIQILVCLAKLMILCLVSSDRVRGLVDYQSLVPIMLRVDERSDNDWVDATRSDNV